MLRTVGTLNAGLVAFGVYLLLSSIRVLFTVGRHSEFPYFRVAFVVMMVLNAVFLVLFLLAAFQLLRLRKAGVVVHAITSAMLIAYCVLNGMLWLAGRGIGSSIAAATGVGNMGIAPFAFLRCAVHVSDCVELGAAGCALEAGAYTFPPRLCHQRHVDSCSNIRRVCNQAATLGILFRAF